MDTVSIGQLISFVLMLVVGYYTLQIILYLGLSVFGGIIFGVVVVPIVLLLLFFIILILIGINSDLRNK